MTYQRPPTYYVIREVSPDAVCSYPRGRTLCNTAPCSRDEQAIATVCRVYNEHCHCPGVRYYPLGMDECDPGTPGYDGLERP